MLGEGVLIDYIISCAQVILILSIRNDERQKSILVEYELRTWKQKMPFSTLSGAITIMPVDRLLSIRNDNDKFDFGFIWIKNYYWIWKFLQYNSLLC